MQLKKWLLYVVMLLAAVCLFYPKEQEVILEDGTYENCYVLAVKDKKMTVLAKDSCITLTCLVDASVEKTDKIADITVEKNQVRKIIWKEGLIKDKVDSVNLEEGWLNLSTYGKKTLSGNGKLYIKSGSQIRILTKAGSLLSRESVSFYLNQGEIGAVVVTGEPDLGKIRVLLRSNENEIFHNKVTLTATENFTVMIDGDTKEYAKGEIVGFERDMGIAKAVCENGKICILSMKRASGQPEYRGEVWIHAREEGFLIRNELSTEEYLYSVVSSEMPSSYPQEALKAQAVCARTYAVYQMGQAYYSEYGAHVDDTVNSQVYNNIQETEETKESVDSTVGQYLSYGGEAICAYFYAASAGHSSDASDVWISSDVSPVYLKGKYHSLENIKKTETKMETLNLSSEEDFSDFILSEPENCIEAEDPWFRWKGSITMEQLSDYVNNNLSTWLKNNPEAYYLKQKEMDSSVKTFGTVREVRILDRSPGGVIRKIGLFGDLGDLTVTGEYRIRKTLCADKMQIVLNDESVRSLNMLPSGYFTVENDGELTIIGGGYGHGVGMSQNGAKILAQMSYSYEDILAFYYPETVLREVY